MFNNVVIFFSTATPVQNSADEWSKKNKRKEGTGMGLSIVTKIIKDHRASINVESNEKETCFTLKFLK